MRLPIPINCDVSDITEALAKVTGFFSSLEEELKRAHGDGPHFERRGQGIHHLGPTPVPTNDLIYTLRYKDQVVATVLQSRTEENYVRFDFFRYDP